MIKGAIFDMDGTLTDTERLYRDTWLKLAVRYGQQPSMDFTRAVCGSNGQEMMNIISRFYPTIDARSFMNDCYKAVAELLEQKVPLKDGAMEILEYMKKRGFKLAIASSSSHAQIEKNMRNCGLFDYFDVFVGGDEVTHSKPHPEIFQLSAKKMGIEPEECYVFEDGMNGLKAGLAAHCKVYMMVDLTEPDDVVAPQCVGVYHSFYEAMEFIEAIEKEG